MRSVFPDTETSSDVLSGGYLQNPAPYFWWLVRLRWFALVAVAAVLLLVGTLQQRLTPTSLYWMWAIAAVLFGYNTLLARLGPTRSRLAGHFRSQILVDCISLTGLVHFSGGADNPFVSLFVLHIVNANILLSRKSAMIVLGTIIGLLVVVTVGEGTGVLTHYCIQTRPLGCPARTLDAYTFAGLAGLALTLIASGSFTRFLTGRLLSSQHNLFSTIENLRSKERKLAVKQDEIERERIKLQSIIDGMNEAVVYCDPQGRILLSNQAARNVWQTLPKSPAVLHELFSKPSRQLVEQFLGHSDEDLSHVFEVEERVYEANHAFVRTKRAEELGIVMVARDVTERLALDRRMAQEERLNVVGKMAATVAHEINNPIGVVSLYSQHALAKLPEESTVRNHLEIVLRNANSCQKIVGNLLDLARDPTPESGRVELLALAQDVVQSAVPIAERSGIQLSLDTPSEEAPLLEVQGDSAQLRQVVLNLVLNAIEACGDNDQVTVAVHRASSDAPPGCAVEVSDTGAGIPEEQLSQIFQPFYTSKAMGTGLGLPVAKRIVTAHGGNIEVDSSANGTTFRVNLPASAEQPS